MKILIFLPNYIGDILQSTPAIKFLKDNLPNVEIGVVAREDRKQLLEDNPDISRVIFKNNLRQLLAEVNQFGPEAIILFRTTFYNCLITSIVQPHFSIGFRQDLSFLFLKKTLPPDSGLSYRAGCYLLVKNFLEEAGQKNVSEINLEKIIFAGWDSPEVIESVRRKLREKRVAPQKNMIVLNPFSSRKTKMLLPGQYVELIKFLLEKFGREYELVIVGNKTEQLIVEHLFNNFPVKNFAGELNLKELGYLLSQAKLFISPDSGRLTLPRRLVVRR